MEDYEARFQKKGNRLLIILKIVSICLAIMILLLVYQKIVFKISKAAPSVELVPNTLYIGFEKSGETEIFVNNPSSKVFHVREICLRKRIIFPHELKNFTFTFISYFNLYDSISGLDFKNDKAVLTYKEYCLDKSWAELRNRSWNDTILPHSKTLVTYLVFGLNSNIPFKDKIRKLIWEYDIVVKTEEGLEFHSTLIAIPK